MAGEFTKVPQEAKSVNDMLIWAAKNGQAENAQDFIHCLQKNDMAAASEALDKLGDYAKATEGLEKVSGHLSTIENMGKVLDIADKVKDGDYLGASVQAGAEVLDATASKFLQDQGPHGIVLDYLAHKTGDELAEKLHEYQGFKDQEVMSQADLNAATVSAWQHERSTLESGVQARIDAGESPEEAQQWARDHIQSHGAIYNDLANIGGNFGDATQNRQITDQLWIVDRANEMAHERDEALAEQAQKEQAEQPEPVKPAEASRPETVEPKEPQQPEVAEKTVEPAQADKPAEPAKPVETVETVEPREPAKPVEPTQAEVDKPEVVKPEVLEPEVIKPETVEAPVPREVSVQQAGDHEMEITINHNTTNIYVVEATTVDNDTINVDQSQQHLQPEAVAEESIPSIPLDGEVPWERGNPLQNSEWDVEDSPLNDDGAPLPTEVDLGLDDSPPIPTEIDIETYDAPLPTEVNIDEVFVTSAEQWDAPIAKMANEGQLASDTTVAENDANVHHIAEGEVVEAERDVDDGYENSYTDENENAFPA